MEKKRNYNWTNQAGLMDIDDMDVVQALNLDPNIAYTPEINKEALAAAQRLAYEGYLEQGLEKADALKHAKDDNKKIIDIIKEEEKKLNKKLI